MTARTARIARARRLHRPNTRGRLLRASTFGLAAAASLVIVGSCGRDPSPGTDPGSQADGLRISWIRPAANEPLSDSVRCLVRIEGGRVQSAELRADGLAVVEGAVEPWTFCWLPPDTAAAPGLGERTIRLSVAAWDTAGNESTSEPRSIRWLPNGPPRLSLVGIESPAWIERIEGESLRVEAVDPEEGTLGGTAIEWRSDREGVIGHGRSLPVVSLIRGHHLLAVRATDRWLRTVSVALQIEAFDYSDRRTPSGVLDDIRYALLDRRPNRYAEALDRDFRFVFCPADREIDPEIPVRWDGASEETFVRRCLSRDDLRFLRAEWTIASLQPAGIDEGALVKAEIVAIEIRLTEDHHDTLTVSGGAARVYLRETSATKEWSVVQWLDLGARTAMTQGRLRIRMAGPASAPP